MLPRWHGKTHYKVNASLWLYIRCLWMDEKAWADDEQRGKIFSPFKIFALDVAMTTVHF